MTDRSHPSAPGAASPLAGYALMLALTFFWGTNWPALKISFSELPVWWFRSLCLLGGGGGLLLIARLAGQSIAVPRAERGPLLLCATFAILGWHLFSGYGVSLMPAGRAAIIAFTMPLWASLLGSLLLQEPLTRSKLAGLALGITGLAVLIGPDLIVLETAPLGAFFMLMSAVSWAIGTVLIKRFTWTLPTTSLVGWQLIAAFVPVTAGALLLEPFPDLSQLSGRGAMAVAYVLVFPMIFCQWAYIKTVRIFPASIAAIGTLAIPVVGVYSSALVLGETVGLRDLAALGLICLALASVLLLPALAAAKPYPKT